MISRSGPLSIDKVRTMLDRMVKSARFNRDTFLALKEDSSATGQALLIGRRFFGGKSDYWSLARPVFFSSSPGLIFLIMSIPVSPVPDVARAIGIAWIAISTVIAAKTALGLDTQRSLVIFIIVTFIVLFSYGLIASL